MLEKLFERPHALARHCNGPLCKERRRYLSHLARQNVPLETLRSTAWDLLSIAEYLRLASRPEEAISSAEVEEQAALWMKRPGRPEPKTDYSRARFVTRAIRWLRFMGRLKPPPAQPDPHQKLITTFARHLEREKGLSSHSITCRCRDVREFLERLGTSGDSLHAVTMTQIEDVLVQKVKEAAYARSSIHVYATSLRSFLGFAQRRGWCRRGLTEAIRSPRIFAEETLPAGPSWEDVRRLLATTEGGQPIAIRDRAMLMLLAVYGLRGGEVGRLCLEDLDWERDMLTVTRSKTRRQQIYPLCRSVGAVILRYLQEVRPRVSRREVFLTMRAPFRPLNSSAIGQVVRIRLHALGLSLPHYGSHTLRYACASHLLEEGLSLKEIGDHLGHRDTNTTRSYTRMDLGSLRRVAELDLEDLL
jgi:integrase/recombinase XerD